MTFKLEPLSFVKKPMISNLLFIQTIIVKYRLGLDTLTSQLSYAFTVLLFAPFDHNLQSFSKA